MKLPFTPGPWRWERVKPNKGGKWQCFLKSLAPIDTIRHHDPLVTAMREDLAAFPYAITTQDALLMEAAPELLSLVRRLIQVIEDRHDIIPAPPRYPIGNALNPYTEPILEARELIKRIEG